MIPREIITAWRNSKAPWNTNEQVELDFIISQSLIKLFSDDFLKDKLLFRGGTALNKLYLSHTARYSEDIDLVQIKELPIGPVIDKIKEVLSFLGNAKVKQKRNNNTLIYKVTSEIPPIVELRLKIEINCREHFTVFDIKEIPLVMNTKVFSGNTDIPTYCLEELLATKLRALYQRKKGRDLFDLWYISEFNDVDIEKVIAAFHVYLEKEGTSISSREFIQNMEEKLSMSIFIEDMNGLLRSEIEYNITEAFNIIQTRFLEKI